MRSSKRNTLAVIGAGPKGIAVAVKAKVLEEAGLPVDRVVLIERHSVGAHWSGEAGFTDGEMRLGTLPEKDVVFPLESALGDPALDSVIKQKLMSYTWVSYLIEMRLYSDWVDRGRPSPRHSDWASYLQWVSQRLAPEVQIIKAQVEGLKISSDKNCWELKLPTTTLIADRLMLTGPGKTRWDFKHKTRPLFTYDLETFWKAIKTGTFKPQGTLAIVGAGENAASALLTLTKRYPELKIEVISPKGFVSTRAENFYENQFYSKPHENGWPTLQLEDKLDFIRRTDIGVFSQEAMKALNDEVRHKIIPGRVTDIFPIGERARLQIEYGGSLQIRDYDQVILATGLDMSGALKSILNPETVENLERMLGDSFTDDVLRHSIQDDLSVKGVLPLLHLPMLAGLTQGPGFANLSCLGLLSDRVIVHPLLKKRKQILEFREA